MTIGKMPPFGKRLRSSVWQLPRIKSWSANLWTLASDMFPRRAVASVAGIGACGGSVSMMFFGLFIGFVLQLTHGNYVPVFLLAGSAYLVAIGVIHLLVPRLAVVTMD
jgi:ACS family hexuronate transporter-like MFS transporter